MEEKGFYKKIGNQSDNLIIKATTCDGQYPVDVITPVNPTEKDRQETEDFLLEELDAHDAYDEYQKKLKMKHITWL